MPANTSPPPPRECTQDNAKYLKRRLTAEEIAAFNELHSQIKSCKKCGLYRGCTRRVIGAGKNHKAPFLFVGECPGPMEDTNGQPFTGTAGEFFRGMMQKAGFIKGDAYFTYVVKCKPNDRQATKEEIGHCSMYLHRQLELINPRVIIAVGSVALKEMAPNCKRQLGSVRGDIIPSYRLVVPVWHPSYVLSSGKGLREKELLKDLKKAYHIVFA